MVSNALWGYPGLDTGTEKNISGKLVKSEQSL